MRAKAMWGYAPKLLSAWAADLRIAADSIASQPSFVAADHNGIVGVVQLDAQVCPWQVKHLWVEPSAARRGIGRALVQHAAGHAASHGQKELCIDADPNAEQFYLRIGARRVGVVPAPIEGEPDRQRPQLMLRTEHPSEERAESMQAYYAARAPEYDKVYAKPERQADLRDIERWLPAVFLGKSVLEVACGTGYWTQFIAPVARDLLGIDAAAETLEIARSRPGAATARFVVGDAYRLPATGAKFDAGFAGFWFSHVPLGRVDEFLRGFHAALAPGAVVVLLDNRLVPGSSLPIAERDAEGNTYQLRQLADGSTHRVLKNFPSEADLRRSLAGMASDVRYHEWPHYWALEYVAEVA